MPNIEWFSLLQYLRRHECGAVTREHFSFSPRMPVGDFYEERESPEVSEAMLDFVSYSFVE